MVSPSSSSPRPGKASGSARAVALGGMTPGSLAGNLRPALGSLLRGRVLLALIYALPCLYMAGYFLPPINHDVATLVDVSRRWLAGERLYLEVIDVNPPLTMMVHAIPVLLERWFGGAATMWWVTLMVTLVLASGLATHRLARLQPYAQAPLVSDLAPLIALFVMAASQAQEFGQREHLMLIGAIPYAFLAGVRTRGGAPAALALPVAIGAGIGFALKPYFLVIPALIEAYVLLQRRSPRALLDPVPWIIGAWVAIHAAIIVFVTPEFLSYTYPIAVSAYLTIGVGPLDVLFNSAMAATTIALALLLPVSFLVRRNPGYAAVALLALGGVIACVAQGKGWGYHTMPAVGATMLLLAMLFINLLDRWVVGASRGSREAALAAALLALVAYPYFLANPPFAYQQRYATSIAKQLGDIIAVESPNKRIMAFSPGIYPFFPTVEYEKTLLAGRFATMWPVQGLYARCLGNGKIYRDLDTAPALEKQVYNAIVEDFLKAKPDVIFVDRIAGIPRCGTEVFDYLAYFSRDPRFAAAMRDYDFAYEFDRYNVWRRKKG